MTGHASKRAAPRGPSIIVACSIFILAASVAAHVLLEPPAAAKVVIALMVLVLVAVSLGAVVVTRRHRSQLDGGVRGAMAQQDRIEQLESRQDELLGILHAIRTGVVAMDAAGNVLDMNHAAMEVLRLAEVPTRGRSLSELGVDGQIVDCARRASAEGGGEMSELVLDAREGQRLLVHAAPMRDVSARIVLVIDDVTRMRRLEQMRSDFAANVSHELRTPITSIQGYAELLTSGTDDDDRERYARIIERNASRLSAIVEDLLSLSRLEEPEKDVDLDSETFPVHELLDEVVRACADEVGAKDVTLKVDCHGHLELHGVRRLLEQGLSNLVVNAVRYGPASSRVVLAARSIEGGEIQLDVTDQGPGIDPAHQRRIFERFYRIDRGRSREVGGTGLGLAIVKHIALVHGGRVEVDSEPGQGAQFSMVLPAATRVSGGAEHDLSAPLIRS